LELLQNSILVAILVEKESHLLKVARYIVLNPVRAKAVRSCKDWKWSSYRATAGFEPAAPFLTTDWILSQFDSSLDAARKAYRKFVSEGRLSPIWDNLRGQIYLGSDAFIEQHVPEGSRAFREIPREQRLIDRPSLQDLFACTAEDEAIVSAYRRHGYRLNEIATFLGVHYSTISRRLRMLESLNTSRPWCCIARPDPLCDPLCSQMPKLTGFKQTQRLCY